MTESVDMRNIEHADLICPITFELFRDPVLAGDGHVYERKAITRWIFQHGTSPLTREPLKVDELQPATDLRDLADQRRNSTTSSNVENNFSSPSSDHPLPTTVLLDSDQNETRSVCNWKICRCVTIIFFIILYLITCMIIRTITKSNEKKEIHLHSNQELELDERSKFFQ